MSACAGDTQKNIYDFLFLLSPGVLLERLTIKRNKIVHFQFQFRWLFGDY